MAQMLMTLSEATGHFLLLKPTTVCLRVNWKVHVACDLNFMTKVKDFLRSQAVTYTGEVASQC